MIRVILVFVNLVVGSRERYNFLVTFRRNLKIYNDPWSDAGMQHRFEFENDIIRRMKQMMGECYSKKPEDFCLKLLFDASFFWE